MYKGSWGFLNNLREADGVHFLPLAVYTFSYFLFFHLLSSHGKIDTVCGAWFAG
jgi:hypothetical protein